MKKNLKKQIKQDELMSWYEHTRDFIAERFDQVKIVLLVVAVLAVGGGALGYFRVQRDKDARDGLSQAMTTFRASVATQAGPEGAAGAQFATEAEKYRKALQDFEGVERRYGSHPAAVRARYYAALCKMELGQLDDALATLKDLAGQDKKQLETALAKFTLAEAERRKGQVDEAIKTYTQLADDAESPLPRDQALMSLAQTLEQARRLNEAQDAYQRIVEEFPSSGYASEAKRKVEYLQARG